MGVRQPLWRMPQAEGGPPHVPEPTHRQPGKDQKEQETWLIWLEPLGSGEICGRGYRLVQTFVGLGQGRHQYGKHPGEDLP